MTAVVAVVVTYNAEEQIGACLDALVALDLAQVRVIDNASHDGTVAAVERTVSQAGPGRPTVPSSRRPMSPLAVVGTSVVDASVWLAVALRGAHALSVLFVFPGVALLVAGAGCAALAARAVRGPAIDLVTWASGAR